MLTQAAVWLNVIAGAAADILLAPIAWLPGWLSATLIAIATGLMMLLVFKYTSNQAAIKRTRNHIKANLLALSLFKDDLGVAFRAQGQLLLAAARLMAWSLVPMLVMLVPMCLVLGQLALWFQARPVPVGEETVVTVHLADAKDRTLPEVQLISSSAVSASIGPVRIPVKQMVCWNVRASEAGCHKLSFEIDGQTFQKEFAVGNGFMPTSLKRPEWILTEVLLHPREAPFSSGSLVRSIEIDFPDRPSWTSGTNRWLWYWFIVSFTTAFAARPLLRVNI